MFSGTDICSCNDVNFYIQHGLNSVLKLRDQHFHNFTSKYNDVFFNENKFCQRFENNYYLPSRRINGGTTDGESEVEENSLYQIQEQCFI